MTFSIPHPPAWRRGALTARVITCAALLLASTIVRAATSHRSLLLDAALTSDALVAIGERGTILRSTDQASTWSPVASPTRATLTAVAFAPNSPSGWAVGHDATILVTTDGGRTWIRQYQGPNLENSFLDVLAVDNHHVIAVGAYGLYLATFDAGKTWTPRKLADDDYHFNRISRGPTGTLYLAGEHGTLLRSSDAGATWTALRTPYTGSFYGVLPLDERTLLAHGLSGQIFRSTDDGETWTHISAARPALLAAAVRTKANHILLAGQSRTLLFSRDAGLTFTPAPDPPAYAIAELLELPSGQLLSVGETGPVILHGPL